MNGKRPAILRMRDGSLSDQLLLLLGRGRRLGRQNARSQLLERKSRRVQVELKDEPQGVDLITRHRRPPR